MSIDGEPMTNDSEAQRTTIQQRREEAKSRIMNLRDNYHGTCDRNACAIRALWDEDCAEIAEALT